MKKLLHLYRYIKLLKKNKRALADSRINNNVWGIYYDWIFRLYTVLVLPFEDKENINKYGIYYIDNMVKAHISLINEYLFSLGILEYVTIDSDNIEQLDQFNIRIVLRFKFMNLKKWVNSLIVIIPIILVLGIAALIIF